MSLILYNPTEEHKLPTYWIRVHQTASSASVVSGAFAYALTHMMGNATTQITKNSISIAGLLAAQGVQYFMGDVNAEKVCKATQTVSEVIDIAGSKATNVAAVITSAATAVTVGSTFLIGKMIHEVYRGFKQREEPENAPEEINDMGNDIVCNNFAIYEISNTLCAPSSEESARQIELPPPLEIPV